MPMFCFSPHRTDELVASNGIVVAYGFCTVANCQLQEAQLLQNGTLTTVAFTAILDSGQRWLVMFRGVAGAANKLRLKWSENSTTYDKTIDINVTLGERLVADMKHPKNDGDKISNNNFVCWGSADGLNPELDAEILRIDNLKKTNVGNVAIGKGWFIRYPIPLAAIGNTGYIAVIIKGDDVTKRKINLEVATDNVAGQIV